MKDLINMMAQPGQQVFVDIDLDDDDHNEQIRCLVLAVWNGQGVVLYGGTVEQVADMVKAYPQIMFFTQA